MLEPLKSVKENKLSCFLFSKAVGHEALSKNSFSGQPARSSHQMNQMMAAKKRILLLVAPIHGEGFIETPI